MIDSLKYAKMLLEVGFTRQQAEIQVGIMTDLVITNFATKEDIKDLRVNLEHRIDTLKLEMNNLESRLTIKLGGIVSVAIGVAVALSKLL